MNADNLKKPYLVRWEIILLLIGLILSIASFIFSIITNHRNERYNSSPNIKIISVDGSHSIETGINIKDTNEQDVRIHCTAVLENVGNAPAQIVNVSWDTLQTGRILNDTANFIAISDLPNQNIDRKYNYYYKIRNNPILGITNTIINADEQKVLEIVFFGKSRIYEGQDTRNIRVHFTLSNGQEISIMPELKYFGVGSHW